MSGAAQKCSRKNPRLLFRNKKCAFGTAQMYPITNKSKVASKNIAS
jgi:hypothetical protein